MPNPKDYGKWIDSAITVIEKANTKDVDKILSNKDIIDKIDIMRKTLILEGFDDTDNCVRLLDKLIEEIK